jgi:hypothetical protein
VFEFLTAVGVLGLTQSTEISEEYIASISRAEVSQARNEQRAERKNKMWFF